MQSQHTAKSPVLLLLAKILATPMALVALTYGGWIFWGLSRGMEQRVYPSSTAPGGTSRAAILQAGAMALIWALPQVVLLIPVWRNRAWGFLILAVLFIMQGSVPLFFALLAIMLGGIPWAMLSFAISSIAVGVVLILARSKIAIPVVMELRTNETDLRGTSTF